MATNVRVELRNYNPNAEFYEKERAFKTMMGIFKRQVNEAGIMNLYKQYQSYESPGEKRRRKRKEAAIERQKERLKEYFINNNSFEDRPQRKKKEKNNER
jgi:ribosomal protein S21